MSVSRASLAKEGVSASKDGGSLPSGPKAFLDQWITKVKPIKFKPRGVVMTDGPAPTESEEKPQQQSTQTSSTPQLTRDQEGGPGSGPHKGTGSKALDNRNAQRDKASNEKRYAKVLAPKAYGAHLQTQESNKPLRESLTFKTGKFLEAAAAPGGDPSVFTRFKSILLQEGLGNFRDGYYYSRQALESAAQVFEGKKIYADHPTSLDEQVRPERSVRDVLGHFENVLVEDGDDGRALLVGEVVIPPDEPFLWARSLMGHSVIYAQKYPDKDFVGLSINASGDATEMAIDKLTEQGVPASVLAKLEEFKEQGNQIVKLVTVIAEAVSCDLVTEAGAGGKILSLLEGDLKMAKKTVKESKEMEKKEMEKKEAGGEMDAPSSDKTSADGAGDGATDDGGQPHADVDQDAELIKKMIAKYLSADEMASEEECGVVKEAYEACKEMGMGEGEAAQHAVHQLKLAKHMASKQMQAVDVDAKKGVVGGGPAEEAEPMMQAEEPKDEKVKESAVTLAGENAALKAKIAMYERGDVIDKMCKEAKWETKTSNDFKALAIVKEAKSVQEIEKLFKMYEAGYKTQRAAGTMSFTEGVFIQPEKAAPQATGGKAGLFDGVAKK